jgi:hypothetical protein
MQTATSVFSAIATAMAKVVRKGDVQVVIWTLKGEREAASSAEISVHQLSSMKSSFSSEAQ